MAFNLLIIDDSESMRAVIRKVVKLSGFEVGNFFEAANGREALDLLEEEWIDLILTDIHMPVMDGIEMLEAMRETDHLSKDAPVILVTTESRRERIEYAYSLGARGYIKKPFTPQQVRSLLDEVMAAGSGAESPAGPDF